jgi:methionyl-tRNA formyltransferase
MNTPHSTPRFAFFGSSRLSEIVLDELEKAGFLPACAVTTPDKPQGRSFKLAPTPVKAWALKKNIPVFEPAKLDAAFVETLASKKCDLFVVASYGKIIPARIINIPPHKTLNIHPSLLPAYRGASPLPSAMLDDAKDTGVTIMRLDEEMDHGPIVAQKPIHVPEWPTYEDFEEMMAREGARLLAEIMPDWVAGKIAEKPQDHAQATYTKKIVKEDGLLDPAADPYLNFRKIQAYHSWPQAYFMHEARDGAKMRNMRVKVTQASFSKGVKGKLHIEKVIPEGKKEMSYKDFVSGFGETGF